MKFACCLSICRSLSSQMVVFTINSIWSVQIKCQPKILSLPSKTGRNLSHQKSVEQKHILTRSILKTWIILSVSHVVQKTKNNYDRYPKPSHRKTRASKAWRMWRNLGAGLHPGNLWAGLQHSRYFGPPRVRLLSPRAAHIINSNVTQPTHVTWSSSRNQYGEKSLDASSTDLIAHNINSNPST